MLQTYDAFAVLKLKSSGKDCILETSFSFKYLAEYQLYCGEPLTAVGAG